MVESERRIADTVGIEAADEAVADSRDGLSVRAEFGVGDVELAADVLNVEGVIHVRTCCRYGCVGETATNRRQRERAVVNINIAVIKVGGEETRAAAATADRRARPDGARRRGVT